MNYVLNNIPAKLVNTTNPRFANYIFEGAISAEESVIIFRSFRNNFHTSYVTKIILEDDLLIVKTRNSTYTFQILSPEFIETTPQGLQFELSEETITKIEEDIKNSY